MVIISTVVEVCKHQQYSKLQRTLIDAILQYSIYGCTLQFATALCGYMTWLIIDGGTWGSWSGFSAWSRTCNGGERIRTRECVGGTNCLGSNIERVVCNTNSCPGTHTSAPGTESSCYVGYILQLRLHGVHGPRGVAVLLHVEMDRGLEQDSVRMETLAQDQQQKQNPVIHRAAQHVSNKV